MHNYGKTIYSGLVTFLLCAALVMGLLVPVTAHAEEENGTQIAEQIQISSTEPEADLDTDSNVDAVSGATSDSAEDPASDPAADPETDAGEDDPEEPEEPEVEGMTMEEWEAFTPMITNAPEVLRATKKKRLKTNAPEGVEVVFSVTNTNYASISKSGLLKAKRVGRFKVKAVFTATVEGKTLKKSVKTAKIQVIGKRTVFIDPGHQRYANLGRIPWGPGSSSTSIKVTGGTVGVATGIPEYQFNLTVAKKLRTALLKKGYAVVMSRTKNNVDIDNMTRAIMANESGASINIHIHADAYSSPDVNGFSVLYPSAANQFPIAKLAKKNLKLAKAINKQYAKATGLHNRGNFVRDDLTGFCWSTIPTIMIECGFFTDPDEDILLNSESFQKKIVKGLVNGIDAYYGF